MTLSPDQWRARGAFFDWRGHRIFGRDDGRGRSPVGSAVEGRRGSNDGAGVPLVLVHGFPTSSWDFAPIWDALAARYRVLTVDLIGYGWSAKPEDFRYSIRAQADLVEDFLGRRGVTRYRLLAHDYGVTVAQELLNRRTRATIERVVLLNGGLFPETHRPVLAQRILASRLGPVFVRRLGYRGFAASMRKIWGARPPATEELQGMWQLIEANDGRRVMPKLIGYMAERRRHRERWVGAIVNATVPIRLINGSVDPVSGAHMVARYRELVARPDVVALAGVGHYPQVEAPEAVLAAALPFLA